MNIEIENIIRDHDYSELNSEQLTAINELASSEEEYTTMRQIIASAPLLNEEIVPSPKLKVSLMETFAATHAAAPTAATSNSGSNRKVIFLWMRGAAAIAAILIVIFMVYPLFNGDSNNELVADNKKVAETKEKEPITKEEPIQENVAENPVEPANETALDGAVESPNRFASVERTAPVSPSLNTERTFPRDGITSSGSTFTVTNFAPTSSSSIGFFGATTISDSEMSEDVFAEAHSDRISIADLPERSRQVIQEHPEILDLLHTSF